MADLNAALVEQFLHISIAEGKAMIEPNSVLDDGHREAARRRVQRPFWPRRGGGRAWRRSRWVSLAQPG